MIEALKEAASKSSEYLSITEIEAEKDLYKGLYEREKQRVDINSNDKEFLINIRKVKDLISLQIEGENEKLKLKNIELENKLNYNENVYKQLVLNKEFSSIKEKNNLSVI